MLKILQVSTRHNVGGISKLIIELLGDTHFEQVYATGVCDNNEKEYSLDVTSHSQGKYKFTRVPRLQRSISFIGDFLALFSLIRIIQKEKPDIIHTHMSKAGLLGRIASLVSIKEIKTVHSFHGHVLDGYFNVFFAHTIIAIERILGHFTDAIVFDGRQTLLEVNSFRIKPKKLQLVILPGLVKSVVMRHRDRVEDNKLRILVVARIEKVKRIDLVLSIARHLTRNYPLLMYEIKIVGDGELRQLFETQAKDEMLPLTFTGWVDDMTEHYQSADLLLSTSDSEGTPITFMEAASFGCPIISTNVGSVTDLVEDGKTGILCQNDAEKMAYEIFNLWMNKDLVKKFSQNSLTKASTEFTLDKFISKHRDLYRDLFT